MKACMDFKEIKRKFISLLEMLQWFDQSPCEDAEDLLNTEIDPGVTLKDIIEFYYKVKTEEAITMEEKDRIVAVNNNNFEIIEFTIRQIFRSCETVTDREKVIEKIIEIMQEEIKIDNEKYLLPLEYKKT